MPWLQLQNEAQARVDRALQARRQRASVLGQETSVESEYLRDIDHRVARKTGRAGRHDDIARSIGKLEVACDHGDYDCLNTAAVKGVCLDDKYGPPESGVGATRLGQIGPPDLATLNVVHHRYQESLSRDLIWARCNAES